MYLKICVIATFFLFLLHEKRLKHSFDCVTYWKKKRYALVSFDVKPRKLNINSGERHDSFHVKAWNCIIYSSFLYRAFLGPSV